MTIMMVDENTKPRNNLVAESDLQASLKAIESTLSDSKYANVAQNDENNSNDDDTLLQQAQISLIGNMKRLVESVSDEAYYKHVTRNIVENEEEESEEESEDEVFEEEDSFQEEELIDQDVLQRARVLRQQVREASERVSKLRSSVTTRAVSVAQREATLLVGPKRQGEPYDASEMQERLSQPFDGNNKSVQLVEMEDSLKNLSVLLQEMGDKVPDTLEMLQETIDTIHQTTTQEASQSLSQTERAIRSRSNEGPSQQQDVSDKAPVARLGAFLGQH